VKYRQEECLECRAKRREAAALGNMKAELTAAVNEGRGRWRDECGIQGKYLESTFENFDQTLQPKAYESMKNYKSGSVVLASPNIYGVGKTHLVSALIHQMLDGNNIVARLSDDGKGIIRARCPAYFVTESRLLSRIRNTYNLRRDDDGETEEDVFRKLSGFTLLVIDDVGKVRPRDYHFLQGVYFRIIDERYVNEQSIILTTNLDFNELEIHIGGACADRLREMCGNNFIKMGGQSYRIKK